MTAAPAASTAEPAQMSSAAARTPTEDLKTFIAAISVVMRETLSRFEHTVADITDLTVPKQGEKPDKDLVVALQAFDRLQQEFAGLSEVLQRLSAVVGSPKLLNAAGLDEPGDDVLATVSVADLKDRLQRHIRGIMIDLSEYSDERIF